MRHEELVAFAGIDVAHHQEKPRVLEIHIGIYVNHGIVAYLDTVFAVFLYCELSESRAVVMRIVLGKESHVASQVNVEHMSYSEAQEKVGVNVEVGHGKHVGVARFLPGDYALPVENAQTHILLERSRDECEVFAMLPGTHTRFGAEVIVGAFVNKIALSEVSVVLDVVECYPQPSVGFLVGEKPFDVGAQFFVEFVVIPPKVLGVVFAEEEGGVVVVNILHLLQV